MATVCRIDDKYIPLYRILWVAATPHFCGAEDCEQEGAYEIRLENGESLWGTTQDRDALVEALKNWHDEDDEQSPDTW